MGPVVHHATALLLLQLVLTAAAAADNCAGSAAVSVGQNSTVTLRAYSATGSATETCSWVLGLQWSRTVLSLSNVTTDPGLSWIGAATLAPSTNHCYQILLPKKCDPAFDYMEPTVSTLACTLAGVFDGATARPETLLVRLQGALRALPPISSSGSGLTASLTEGVF